MNLLGYLLKRKLRSEAYGVIEQITLPGEKFDQSEATRFGI